MMVRGWFPLEAVYKDLLYHLDLISCPGHRSLSFIISIITFYFLNHKNSPQE